MFKAGVRAYKNVELLSVCLCWSLVAKVTRKVDVNKYVHLYINEFKHYPHRRTDRDRERTREQLTKNAVTTYGFDIVLRGISSYFVVVVANGFFPSPIFLLHHHLPLTGNLIELDG